MTQSHDREEAGGLEVTDEFFRLLERPGAGARGGAGVGHGLRKLGIGAARVNLNRHRRLADPLASAARAGHHAGE